MVSNVFIDFGEVGKRISARRGLLDMSQKELAAEVGLDQSSISKIEVSGVGLSAESILAICKALKVEPNYLLCGIEASSSMVEKVSDKVSILTNEEHLKILSGNIDVMANIDVI